MPATRFRVLAWLPLLRALGHECSVAHSRPPKYAHFRWLGWRLSQRVRRWSRRLDIWRAARGRFDVVFLERELFDDDSVDLEQRLAALSAGLVWDVDDAIFLRHPEKFETLARLADVVFVGNERLRERVASQAGHVLVIPTCIDTDRTTPVRVEPRHAPIIGWIGTSSNLPYVLEIAPALLAVQRSHGARVQITSDASPLLDRLREQGLSFEWREWSDATELADLQNVDVGIMPLPDTEWSQYKCGLKLLQYMAVGRPVVASPVGVNATIVVAQETGLLARDVEEWRASLVRLIEDSELRQRMGAAGRRRAEAEYSLAVHLPQFLKGLEAACRTNGLARATSVRGPSDCDVGHSQCEAPP